MKYILDQEEFDRLNESAASEKARMHETLQDLCTKVADHMPTEKPYAWKEGDPLVPHGCILSIKEEYYCDHCPVREVCPNPYKEFSK